MRFKFNLHKTLLALLIARVRKGYRGDGLSNGKGCTREPPSEMTIKLLIGKFSLSPYLDFSFKHILSGMWVRISVTLANLFLVAQTAEKQRK
ncbi:hypothetical protein SASPL_120505 [Salvia splendens]|uniref:Uncharacterized protein n=1 Tax=Salvia splendens TaxID=180675 RepID=A0A8X8ZVA3_SALSN|nr:hypothetical protein SASPL_120505 [Salvia splendens]